MSAGRELELLTLEVCRRFHLDGWTKSAVADHFGLSRFQVARMLERARDRGWVRIEIDTPAWVDAELGDRVRDRLGLRHAVVVRAESPGAMTRAEMASATARLLESVLTPDDILGLAWSRTIAAAVEHMQVVPRVPVVQLTGALPRPDEGSSVELVRRFASTSGGPAYIFYAPTILSDETAAKSMREQPEVAGALDRLSTVTVALVAAGGWAAGASTLYDGLPPTERAEVAGFDVLGEISGIFIGPDGALPRPPISRRLLCPSAGELIAVPHVIAAVPGEHNAAVVRSAVASGVANSVVISQSTADDLLNLE